jgi:stage II sporulation protein D
MDRSYSGQFEFFSNNSTIDIVLHTPEEAFIASIASSEMREAQEPEAITAFAIVSRSFLVDGGRHPELHADFCDTTHCQVFQNLQADPEITTAVQKSESLVLTFHKQPFRPYYSRSCGGRTATFQDAWGKHSQPYEFAVVSCPCGDRPLRWQASLSSEELAAITGLANAKLIRTKNRIDVSSGNIEKQFPLEVFRTKLGKTYGWNKLPGNSYKLEQTSDGYVFHGNGQGHGVGFCQIGAEILAARGLKFSEIISHYFPGCEIKTAKTQRGALN